MADIEVLKALKDKYDNVFKIKDTNMLAVSSGGIILIISEDSEVILDGRYSSLIDRGNYLELIKDRSSYFYGNMALLFKNKHLLYILDDVELQEAIGKYLFILYSDKKKTILIDTSTGDKLIDNISGFNIKKENSHTVLNFQSRNKLYEVTEDYIKEQSI